MNTKCIICHGLGVIPVSQEKQNDSVVDCPECDELTEVMVSDNIYEELDKNGYLSLN